MTTLFRLPIAIILALFLAVSGAFAVTTPLFEASDELWHYPVVWRLSHRQGLPVLDTLNPGPWRQEAGQPPLYYYIMALATGWIDTNDIHNVRRLNPHVDNGVVTADGNINLAIHNNDEKFPWNGTVLAVRGIRLLSVLLSAGTVYLTYLLSLEIQPSRPLLATSAAALLAFTPMFAFISGSVNNDNLAMLLASASVLLITRMSTRADARQIFRFTYQWKEHRVYGNISISHLVLGILLGLGVLTKLSLLALFPIAAAMIAYKQICRWWSNTHSTHTRAMLPHALIIILQYGVTFGIAAAISGWWFYRNIQLYGSLTGLNMFVAVLGRRAHPASLLQLWSERAGFMQSFWGLFGGVNLPFPPWVYFTLNLISLLALAGLLVFIIRKWMDDRWNLRRWLPVGVPLSFTCVVIISLLRWSTETWSSQGRLVFTAIQSLFVLFAIGLNNLVPNHLPHYRRILVALVVLFMLALSASTPKWLITPAYDPPEPANLKDMKSPLEINFQSSPEKTQMRLLGYTLPSASLRPGDLLELTLFWQVMGTNNKDWSVFVHLQDSRGMVIAQRDTYPGLGLLATSEMQAGHTVADSYVLSVPATSDAPTDLLLNIGLYDYTTGERLRTIDGLDKVQLGTVQLNAHVGQYPNVQQINFQNHIELVGYEIDRRVLSPGQALNLTLYWRGLHKLKNNYTIFTHLRGDGNRVWAQHDSWPVTGNSPTTTWVPGEVVLDLHPIVTTTEVPHGTYELHIGIYESDGQRLQIIADNGQWTDNYLSLGLIRVTN